MKQFLLMVGLVGAFASQAAAELIPGSQFSYQAWSGGAYSNDVSGSFSHCAISAGYVSGNTLHFSVNRDASVSVGVSGNLGLRKGQQFPVALYIDRKAPFYGTADALSESFAVLKINQFDAAMTAFKKGFNLKIEALGGVSDYSLKGTFRALEAARQCTLRNFDYRAAADAPPTSVPTIDRTVLFQLSAMVLSDLGVDGFRYLNQNELQERGWQNAVAWEAQDTNMSGLFLLVPGLGSESLRSTDPVDTQFIANGCEGDYATSARGINIEGDGGEVRELLLVCEAGGIRSEIFLTKFAADENVVYTIIRFDDVSETSGLPSRKQMSERAVVRAASFITE